MLCMRLCPIDNLTRYHWFTVEYCFLFRIRSYGLLVCLVFHDCSLVLQISRYQVRTDTAGGSVSLSSVIDIDFWNTKKMYFKYNRYYHQRCFMSLSPVSSKSALLVSHTFFHPYMTRVSCKHQSIIINLVQINSRPKSRRNPFVETKMSSFP